MLFRVVFFAYLLAFTACSTVPHTGRQAIHLMSHAELAQSAAMSFSALKREQVISIDPAMNAMLQRVGQRIARVASPDMPSSVQWEFVVFEDNQLNAFAMPGGANKHWASTCPPNRRRWGFRLSPMNQLSPTRFGVMAANTSGNVLTTMSFESLIDTS